MTRMMLELLFHTPLWIGLLGAYLLLSCVGTILAYQRKNSIDQWSRIRAGLKMRYDYMEELRMKGELDDHYEIVDEKIQSEIEQAMQSDAATAGRVADELQSSVRDAA